MLETDNHNIFGAGGGAHGATTFKPGAVTHEMPTDGRPYFRRDILGAKEDMPTQYVLLEEIMDTGSIIEAEGSMPVIPESYIPLQRTHEISEAVARIGLNAQLAAAQ